MDLKIVAQQATKLLNVTFPGAGSVISSTIAGLGTKAIGMAAIAYFVDDKDLKEAKKVFESAKKEEN